MPARVACVVSAVVKLPDGKEAVFECMCAVATQEADSILVSIDASDAQPRVLSEELVSPSLAAECVERTRIQIRVPMKDLMRTQGEKKWSQIASSAKEVWLSPFGELIILADNDDFEVLVQLPHAIGRGWLAKRADISASHAWLDESDVPTRALRNMTLDDSSW